MRIERPATKRRREENGEKKERFSCPPSPGELLRRHTAEWARWS